MITAELLSQTGLATPEFAARVADPLAAAAVRFGIDTEAHVAGFLAQCAQESGCFRRTVENLNYSAALLREFWPKRFSDEATAQAYAHQQERIGNRAYGGRLGNGPEATGDGYRYRGRGFIQLTGKNNYAAFGKDIGIDVVSNPDLVATTKYAALSAAWFWSINKLNPLADTPSVEDETRIVNGGTHGLKDRQAYYDKVMQHFAAVRGA